MKDSLLSTYYRLAAKPQAGTGASPQQESKNKRPCFTRQKVTYWRVKGCVLQRIVILLLLAVLCPSKL